MIAISGRKFISLNELLKHLRLMVEWVVKHTSPDPEPERTSNHHIKRCLSRQVLLDRINDRRVSPRLATVQICPRFESRRSVVNTLRAAACCPRRAVCINPSFRPRHR